MTAAEKWQMEKQLRRDTYAERREAIEAAKAALWRAHLIRTQGVKQQPEFRKDSWAKL